MFILLRSSARISMATMKSLRPFCVAKSSTKLRKVLSKELEYERDNYTKLEDTEPFLKESGFAFTEEETGVNCYLTKKVEGKEVIVHFQARAPAADDAPEEGDQ